MYGAVGVLVTVALVGCSRNSTRPPATAEIGTASSDSRQRDDKPTPRPTFDYRTPFHPFNDGVGGCHDPHFSIEPVLPFDHTYHRGETMSVKVRYDAPGCVKIYATFGVRHVPGSPRYTFYCRNMDPAGESTCKYGFDGNIPSEDLDFTSPSGEVTLTAQPGAFPPAEVAAVPDLEGAQLCSVVVGVSDGLPNGSRSDQQLNVACPEGFYSYDSGPTATAIPRTPSIPPGLVSPAVLMFCEPLQQAASATDKPLLAGVPDGSSVVYKPHSCEPDIDASGAVAILHADGSTSRDLPSYEGNLQPDRIVWVPAKGTLRGSAVIMTAKFLKRAASVERDSFGMPLLQLNTTPDGREILGSLTQRLSAAGGTALAIFIDGVPLRGAQGNVLAPRVLSRITDTLLISGLQEADAQSLARLVKDGHLE